MRGRRKPERVRWGEQSRGGEGEGRLLVMPSRAPGDGEKTAYKAAQQVERQMLNDRRRANQERAAAELAEAKATPQMPAAHPRRSSFVIQVEVRFSRGSILLGPH